MSVEVKAPRGFAVLGNEDGKETKKEKAEDSEEMVSRVVAVQEEEDKFDDVYDDDSWSEHTDIGPITTDALTSTTPKPVEPERKPIKRVRRKRTATINLVKGKSQKQLPKAHVPKKVKNIKPKPRKYKAIGRTITKGDKSYELMFDMLLGIRISVSGVSAKKKIGAITRNDITEVDNYFMPSAGTIHTPAHPGRDFQFSDYAPKVFRDLRENHGIDSADYLISLTGDYVLSEIVSPGKSGSFFYFSHDTKYMLKTITPGEKRFFKKILRAYYQHVMDHPDTLVIRFYGFHMVQPHGGPKMHFVVMGNIFAQSLDIQERYDLKGSSIGRTAGDPKTIKSTTILKDLDLKRKLFLGPEKCSVLFDQLEKDVEFLQRQDIMDYSLLLGIHNKAVAIQNSQELPEEFEEDPNEYHTVFTKDHGGFQATDGSNDSLPEIYFMGVIDILQPYNISKQVEHTWKSNILRQNRFEISAVSPTVYAERFLRFMKAHVSIENSEKLRKDLKHETRLLKRKKRMDRKTLRLQKKERSLKRRVKKENGETATEFSEFVTSEFDDSSVTGTETQHKNETKKERKEVPRVEMKESLPARMLQEKIATDSSVDAVGVTSEPVLSSVRNIKDTNASAPQLDSQRVSPMTNGSESVLLVADALDNVPLVERSVSQPVSGKKQTQFGSVVVSSSHPTVNKTKENENENGLDDSVEVVEEVEDLPVFNSRVPKRKRVKEKSLLHIHNAVLKNNF